MKEDKKSKLIEFIVEKIKKHEDYMKLIKEITGHDIEYSNGSVAAYNSVLEFINSTDL